MLKTADARLQKAMDALEQYSKNGVTKDALSEILCLAVETTEAEAGTFWFYHRFEDGLIRPVAVYGGEALTNIYLLPGEGIAGQTIDKGEAMLIADCKTDPRWTKKVDVETGFVTESTVCVPMKTENMVFGAIQLVNKKENERFDKEDLALLEKLTEQISELLSGTPLLGEYNEALSHQSLEREKDVQRSIIKRLSVYMDPAIIHEILRDDGKHKKSIETREAVVMFADIRGFTGLAQHISTTQLISALSDFLALTSRCIHEHGGIIDKFMGDCVMAYWCCEENPTAAQDACRCALKIQQLAKEYTERLVRQTEIKIGIGIGVHVGPVLLCHLGDEKYMAYTAIGSSVNTACRIEEHTPSGKVYISQDLADKLAPTYKAVQVKRGVQWKNKDEKLVILNLKKL